NDGSTGKPSRAGALVTCCVYRAWYGIDAGACLCSAVHDRITCWPDYRQRFSPARICCCRCTYGGNADYHRRAGYPRPQRCACSRDAMAQILAQTPALQAGAVAAHAPQAYAIAVRLRSIAFSLIGRFTNVANTLSAMA